MDNMDRLACDILCRAVIDYHSALNGKKLRDCGDCEETKRDCESFFKSEWCDDLLTLIGTQLKGEDIITCIKYIHTQPKASKQAKLDKLLKLVGKAKSVELLEG